MGMPGRQFSDESGYRYGFNGKENDIETSTQDYGMRIYDPKLGRFLSLDPITKEYPELTPYQFASNTPIWALDLDGLEGFVATGINGHGMVLSVKSASRVNQSISNWASSKHQQGVRNVKIAEHARQMAIKQGRTDGDGITRWTKAMLYIAPWWNSTATFSDANDGAVLMSGKNLDGSEATFGDYTAAGIGVFIPFVSGSAAKRFILEGFSTSVNGYRYGSQVVRNADEFDKALVKAGSYEDKKAMIQTVLRQVANTNSWKKSNISDKHEFFDLGSGRYASIDKQHGHFEIFKKEGKTLKHQGSINIDGFQNKDRNKKYDIKL